MDQIAQQLKEEIDSLREYIKRTEERLLVSSWVDEMITPFEDTEHEFNQEELGQIVGALYKARHQFSVNGLLGGRLDAIIDRYSYLFKDGVTNTEDDPIPAKDPQNDNVLDFVEDEEEENEVDGGPALFEPFISTAPDIATDLSESQDSPTTHGQLDQPDEEDNEQTAKAENNREFEVAEDKRDNAVLDLFNAKEERNGDRTESPTRKKKPSTPQPITPPLAGEADTLFAQQNKQPLSKQTPGTKNNTQKQSQRDTFNPGVERSSKIRQRTEQQEEQPSKSFEIFSDHIAIDDLLLDLGIQLPEQDLVQLNHALNNKLSSSTVAALQKNPEAEGQYVLIPRISRFIFNGTLYPCTVKNLARTYIALFGDIKDLMQYKGMPFLTYDTPELGWSLITREAARDTNDKNFMQQNQQIRYMATTAGIPSHLVRRRTLIETIYDMIVGRMVLKTTFLKHTLDWTSDGPNRSEFICAYFSERGIRLRHLPRTQHNRALGLCPNW